MKIYKIILLLITSRKFRVLLRDTLFYAINLENYCRGDGSCDVMLFKSWFVNEIFTKEELIKNSEKDFSLPESVLRKLSIRYYNEYLKENKEN